jgi:hypothetical protein
MIVEYITATKEIVAAHYGRAYIASEWSSYGVSGQAVINCPSETEIAGKYLVINEDGTGSFSNETAISVSVNKTDISANGSDYCDFSGIPEGATIYLEGSSAGTADSDGTLRFTATDAGSYVFKFFKYTYASQSITIVANDEYLYDNITG